MQYFACTVAATTKAILETASAIMSRNLPSVVQPLTAT